MLYFTRKVTWPLTAEEKEDVRNILKHVTDMRRPQVNYKHSVLNAFLHEDDAFPDTTIAEEDFVPAFPRNPRAGQGSAQTTNGPRQQTVRDLPSVIPNAVMGSDDSNMSFSKATLEMVDGWHTLKVSSPISAATPTSSQEDSKIDQLFLENSPLTDPTIGMIDEMIEIYVPRSHRIGGAYGKKPHILHGQSLATFIAQIKQRNLLESTECKSSSPTHDSLAGQASVDTISRADSNNSDERLNMDILRFYPGENETDVIMKDKIENSDLMEVPPLLSPNKHMAPSYKLPTRLSDLIRDAEGQSDRRPLKKVLKGLSTLRLSLSWVAFTTDTPLPSHEEICDVSVLPSSVTQGIDNLLCWALGDGSPGRDRFSALQEDVYFPRTLEIDSPPLILISRKNREAGRKVLSSIPTLQDQKRSTSDVHSSSLTMDAEKALGQPRTSPGADTYQEWFYDLPSVPHIEYKDITHAIYEHSDAELSSIDHTRQGAATNIGHADTPDVNIHVDNVAASSASDQVAYGVQGIKLGAALLDLSVTADWTAADKSGSWTDSNISHLSAFTKLRAKALGETPEHPVVPPSSLSSITQESHSEDITMITNDKSTLMLPDADYALGWPHRYMASMDFVQRQAIVRELRQLNIDLAERTSLGGIELIIDPFSAILVCSLFTLPACGKFLASRIAEHSWRFQHILVLLEGYPETLSYRPPKSKLDVPELSAYTPPIVKAIKKLRRDVTIAEACGKKNPKCNVNYSFANDTSEAGKVIRYFGDLAEERDRSGGVLWQSRDWLDDEELPDVEDLSKLDGMNRMSAMILLCKASVDEILEMIPEERMENFGSLIGTEAVDFLNNDIHQRFNAIDASQA